MAYQDIEESRLYRWAEGLGDAVWDIVVRWQPFARCTVGRQLTRSADSIGANIAESAGRLQPNDVIRFLFYARGSLRETRFWLKRAHSRQLFAQEQLDAQMSELDTLGKELNAYINDQRSRRVKEDSQN